MEQEQIDKCLGFAEGNKGKYTIRQTKNSEFPENLLRGTEKQRKIKEYIDEGYTTRQVAEAMQCTQPTIVEHMGQYRKGVKFHNEWCEFWGFIQKIRKIPISEAFKDILTEKEMEKYKKKGITTVGDYLKLSVTMTSGRFCAMLGEKEAEKNHKAEIFQCVKEMCYELLTVMK